MQKNTNIDELTGLLNRTGFLKEAQIQKRKIKDRDEVPCIVYMNCVNMQRFNHQHGTASGDKLLQDIGDLLSSIFGEKRCSRFSADHFVVCTEQRDVEDNLDVLFLSIRSLYREVSIKVGIYIYNSDVINIEGACDFAKLACDALKSMCNTATSKYLYCTQGMEKDMHIKEYVLSNFETALNQGWLTAVYQPIMSADGNIYAREALSRWSDPVHGNLSPSYYVPILEESGAIYKLTLYMLDKIIHKLKADNKNNVPITLNVSVSDFKNCDLLNIMNEKLTQAHIDKSKIIIEITERDLGKYANLLKGVISILHQNGYKVWLDDFGSDYSSLNILSQYPFDIIKLDIQFLRNFNDNVKGKIFIEGILDFTNKIHMDAVVEGVETNEQAEFLKQYQNIKMQGFLYGRPMP